MGIGNSRELTGRTGQSASAEYDRAQHPGAHVPDAVINTRLAQSDQNRAAATPRSWAVCLSARPTPARPLRATHSPEQAEHRRPRPGHDRHGPPTDPGSRPAQGPQSRPRSSTPSPSQQEQPGRVVQFPAHEPEAIEPKPDRAESDPKAGPGRIRPGARRHFLDRLGMGQGQRLSWTIKTLEEAIGQSINQANPHPNPQTRPVRRPHDGRCRVLPYSWF